MALMPKIVKQATITAPAARIFALLQAAERNEEWVPGCLRSERLTPGPTRVGTRFRFLVRPLAVAFEVVDEVVEFIPDRLLRFRSVRGVWHEGYWLLEPEDGATRVTYCMDSDLPPGAGLLAGLLRLEARIGRQAEDCLRNLRQVLETEIPVASA